MLTFVVRRLLATILVVLAASFIVFSLTSISGDPLRDLKESSAANRQERIDARTEQLNLNDPIPVRYVSWLGGAAKCIIGQCDLGTAFSRGDQPVTDAIGSAVTSTLQLISAATILAIVLGLSIGMITALRQYSGFDYVITFFTFILYSLPIFWVAVLLKEYGAIRFNAFLSQPDIPWWVILLIAIGAGFVWMSIIGGDLRRRGIAFAGGALATGLILGTLVLTRWFEAPTIGIVGILITGAAIAFVITLLSTGLQNRRALLAAGTTVVFWAAVQSPLQFLFFTGRDWWWIIPALVVVGILVGIASGYIFGKDDKRQLARTAALTGGLVALIVVVDRVLLVYPEYLQRIPIKNGAIATIGSQTPGLDGDIWITMLDTFTHLLLPTIALTLISFAAYTRYARGSLLEVMNQDYVRTARAKGLTERTVIMRHAFRNAMIPIATIISFDIGALIGGAIITETIFAWQGMGYLFNVGLGASDVNIVMGVFLVTGVVAVIFNLIADLVYAALDPRIRVA